MQSIMILKGEQEGNKYFVAFSRLLRQTLDMSNRDRVSLKEEIEYINNYLLLSNLQFNEEIEFSIIVEESVVRPENIYLPGMLIQPFVENAIIHGLVSKKGNKRLTIKFYIENQYLVVWIDDNGIGREASSELSKTRSNKYKSWSTEVVTDRIKIINDIKKGSILFKIHDKVERSEALGTTAVLKFIL